MTVDKAMGKFHQKSLRANGAEHLTNHEKLVGQVFCCLFSGIFLKEF